MTIFLNELTGLPAPSDFELEAMDRRINWPGFNVVPTTRCGLEFYVQYRNINGARPYFHQFLVEQGRDPTDVLTIAQWDSLVAVFDAQDERETQMGARYAGASW